MEMPQGSSVQQAEMAKEGAPASTTLQITTSSWLVSVQIPLHREYWAQPISTSDCPCKETMKCTTDSSGWRNWMTLLPIQVNSEKDSSKINRIYPSISSTSKKWIYLLVLSLIISQSKIGRKKIIGPSRGSNAGPLADMLGFKSLSENHTTRPPGR